MSIIVFSGSDEYNSYISLADANEYHTARAVVAWTSATTEAKEAALIRATDYIDLVYQPRDKADNAALLARACVNLAISALSGPLVAEAEREIVETEKELTGVGKTRVKLSEKDFDRFPFVTQMLRPISSVKSGSGSYSVRVVK